MPKVHLEKENKTVNVQAKTVAELLKKLELNPTICLVSVNDELVTTQYKIKSNDKIKILPVVSGG